MESCLVKTGASSAVLGRVHYRRFVEDKKGKLAKITSISPIHNDYKLLDIVRRIYNYEDYYAIQDEAAFILTPSSPFFQHVSRIAAEVNIFHDNVYFSYIDYAGDKDLLQTLDDITKNRYDIYWSNCKKIYNFAKHILMGLYFLHEKKMCHLDIKPENLMVNTRTGKYKIIDFGFSSKYPFDDYVTNVRGTPGYFPKEFDEDDSFWLPKIKANDFHHPIPMLQNRDLVYKVDSYCFGRVLTLMKNIYSDYKVYMCYDNERKFKKKLDEIITCLSEDNVYCRYTVKECIEKYL